MRSIVLSAVLCVAVFSSAALAKNAEEDFRAFCQETFAKKGTCPDDICQKGCVGGKKEKVCIEVCSPKPCPEIAADECPAKYCAVMTNCSKEKVCHYQMYGEKAQCGNLAYAGQDVACCPGLVRRCGIEFFDGSCDMEGKNSVYALPICIPCGDGVCSNFENHCNCPEDCKNPTLDNPVKKTDDKTAVNKAGSEKKR